jgi:hypothetical protein
VGLELQGFAVVVVVVVFCDVVVLCYALLLPRARSLTGPCRRLAHCTGMPLAQRCH